ncbi:MAG: hypothetical protein Q9195_004188 [Heterodermia aff. obscurata]
MLDYDSVIRVLLRHGCELKGILNSLLNDATTPYALWLFASGLGFEEETDAEADVDARARLAAFAELDSEQERYILNSATQGYKAILERPPDTLLHWLSFLFDQGLDVNNIDDRGFTLLMKQILSIINPDRSSPFDRGATLVVLALCLLKVDVSIRLPGTGWQALHMLFYASRNVVGTSTFSDLAYVLIRYGGADVHATTYDGASPLLHAVKTDWRDEWFMVLRRCRISLSEYLTKEVQCLHRFHYLGNGDSTALDTNDQLLNDSETVTKRKPLKGDRLEE